MDELNEIDRLKLELAAKQDTINRLIMHSAWMGVAVLIDELEYCNESWISLPDDLQKKIDDYEEVILDALEEF